MKKYFLFFAVVALFIFFGAIYSVSAIGFLEKTNRAGDKFGNMSLKESGQSHKPQEFYNGFNRDNFLISIPKTGVNDLDYDPAPLQNKNIRNKKEIWENITPIFKRIELLPRIQPIIANLPPPNFLEPIPDSTLSSEQILVSWQDVGADMYELAVGEFPGDPSYGWYGSLISPEVLVTGLPTDGGKIHFKLFTHIGGTVLETYIEVTAHTGAPPPPPPPDPEQCADFPLTAGPLSAVWANDGGDKVVQHDTRASSDPCSSYNSIWDGEQISLFGAKNEVVNFNLVLESENLTTEDVSISFDDLSGPNGAVITGNYGGELFDWVDREIELFYIRYLPIRGLSKLFYETYDERHIPERLRRPFTGEGAGEGLWEDRPDHDAYYPDIAVPLQLEQPFDVTLGTNQSVWADVYIPDDAPDGEYIGEVDILVNNQVVASIPVNLSVADFVLPQETSAKNMAFFSRENVNRRYTGDFWTDLESDYNNLIRDRHFQLAHRHKISLIDDGNYSATQPRSEWDTRLDGSLFTPAYNYDGPGVGVPTDIYSIGTYGSWQFENDTEEKLQSYVTAWEEWFQANSPDTERFLYLIDESEDYPLINTWANWVDNAPGVGSELPTMATISAPQAVAYTPALDIIVSGVTVGDSETWQTAADTLLADPDRDFYVYNGKRPANGSFALEDDGVALRQLVWTQFKKNVSRWFLWETTYYDNYQGGLGETNVFENAQTFGGYSGFDPVLGETGWNYSNGDGVLFYPGTDMIYPQDSYDIDGPIASLRLKHWRRGIQDMDYLELARQIDPEAVDELVESMIPQVLWDYGVDNPADPSYVHTDISWSTDPDVWEDARKQLSDIIIAGQQQPEKTLQPNFGQYSCIQIITYARYEEGGECQAFPTPCDVPFGWDICSL